MKKVIYLALVLGLFSCKKSSEDIQTKTDPKTEVDPKTDIKTGKITNTIDVAGTKREYIVYIPKNYSSDKKYPLLFAFHGLGGSMQGSYDNSKFHLLAETENFISVHPNGISSKWNAITANNNVDIAFTKALIEKLKNTYSIDSKRIYSSGMSNGGYFSFLLACEMSDQIAAIGSVTGLMFKKALINCKPTKPVPIMQIHGTSDPVVDYSGVDKVISYWVKHNKLNGTPTKSAIPDTNKSDGSTVERFVYKGTSDDVEIQHLKVTGGGHDWPGHKGNMDIKASEEVWNFVKKYDINGKIK